MKTVTINERAAAQALLAIVGPEQRRLVEELYMLLDAAERAGWQEGFDVGYKAATNTSYNDGFQDGYQMGADVVAGGAQPDLSMSMPLDDDYFVEAPRDGVIYSHTGAVNALPPMQEQRDAVNRVPGETQYVKDAGAAKNEPPFRNIY